MPQWRKLHTKIVRSLDFNEMPDDFTRLLWMLLPTQLCKYGRGLDRPVWIRSTCFPIREDVTLEMVATAMDWLAERDMIRRYSHNGNHYFYVPTWHDYQSTDKEGLSEWPPPPELATINSGPTPELRQPNSGPTPELRQQQSSVDVDKDGDKDVDGDKDSEFTASAVTAKPPSAPRQPSPPAVAVFYKNTNRNPHKTMYADIVQAVGDDPADLDFWGKVVHAWIATGFKPTNVAGMLDCFRKRQLPGDGRRQQQVSDPIADYHALAQQEGWIDGNQT